MTYSVNLWGSHPENENDDCWCGSDFATLAEATAAFNNPASAFKYETNWAYVEIDGPGINEVRKNPNYRKPRYSDDGNEFAMQQGMAFGCDGYNDAMGY